MNEIENPFANNKQPDGNINMKVAGYNLAAMLIYGLLFVGVMGNDGLVVFGLLFLAQAFICVVIAIVKRKWVWFLSAVLIAIIGFSTCASLFHLNVQ